MYYYYNPKAKVYSNTHHCNNILGRSVNQQNQVYGLYGDNSMKKHLVPSNNKP